MKKNFFLFWEKQYLCGSKFKNVKFSIMTQISGITIERADTGHPAYIKFEYDKYVGLLQHFLQEHNMEIPLLPNDTTMVAIKEAQNYRNFERYDSAESLLADCLKD